MAIDHRILVTGASGQLGRLVLARLLESLPASQISALVRSDAAAGALEPLGIDVRLGNYDQPKTLARAFAGVDRVLLISSNELGKRAAQHRGVIDAAKSAGVGLLAYTSVLHAPTSALGLAEEHRQTEVALLESGVPHALLRNGWYTENYAASIPPALAHSAFIGSAGEGLIASASRADYADAAAAVLTSATDQSGKVYELAGDAAYTLAQFVAEVARRSGKPVTYHNLPELEYKAALVAAGLPEPVAALLSNSDAAAAKGALFDDGHALSRLIGRPTTPFAETIRMTLSK